MKAMPRQQVPFIVVSVIMYLSSATMVHGQIPLTQMNAKEKQAYDIGMQAYIWGYPMVGMQKCRDAMTNARNAPVTRLQFRISGKFFSPVNQVASAWDILGPFFTSVPSVNCDTLYSVVWCDTSKEPQLLQIPDANGRYYTFQFVDAYTNNFYYASSRTMGSQKQKYALVPSGWTGKVPKDVIRVESPTPTFFIIGRWFVADKEDVRAVNVLQEQVTMKPLSSYGKPYTAPKGKIVRPKKHTGDLAFFEQLGDTLAINGALSTDAKILGLLKKIGLSVEHGFDPSFLTEGEKKAMARSVRDGERMLAVKSTSIGKEINGWQLSPVMDEYFGNNYLFRAKVGYQAMFINTPIEAYYPCVFKDSDGEALDGSTGKYTITFPKGKTPPANAFWSLSMYNKKTRGLIRNSISRYKVGSIDNLKTNEDGSTTIYIQSQPPEEDKQSNWLPAPDKPFYMLLRIYLPKVEVLIGQYEIPGVVRMNKMAMPVAVKTTSK